MITIKRNNRGLKFGYVYFAEEKDPNIDYGYYIGAKRRFNKSMLVSPTLITNLTCSKEEIFEKFKSKVRTEVRWSERVQPIIKRYISKEITDSLVESIIINHRHFHQVKGLVNEPFDIIYTRYLSLRDMGKLHVSICQYQGEDYIYHVYVVDDKKTVLNMSFSNYREHLENRQVYGKLNRYLHWMDICYFMDDGYSLYDWGGTRKV